MTESKPTAVDERPIPESLRIIYAKLPRQLKLRVCKLLALMLLGALAELLAIGAVLPFLTILANPDRAQTMPVLSTIFDLFRLTGGRSFVLTAAGLFAISAIAAGAVRLWLVWAMHDVVFSVAHHIGVDIQRRMLYQPYSYYVGQNTSEVIAALEKVQVILFNVLIPAVHAVSSTVITLFIVSVLVYIDPVTALSAAAGFSATYMLVSAFSRQRLKACSETINSAYKLRVQAVQESLGGIRDIIIDRSQPLYVDRFARIDRSFRRAQATAAFISAGPRFAIEGAGMVLISVLAVLLWEREGGLIAALPILGALAVGAQRLLPLLQLIYYGWSSLTSGGAMLGHLVAMLRLPGPEEQGEPEAVEPLPFACEIRIEQVSFRFPNHPELILSDINLVIPKGSRVALIGKTGSGKSTLIDLIMGLLQPERGRIAIDSVELDREARRRWQTRIAHVPQAIFLADTTIERNIAFGAPGTELDRAQIVAAARQAQLHEFIETLPAKYQTSIGERGIRLSGGQRQRLGIARALYKQASVLILDEATSALDDATEAAVMESLHSLGEELTVIMVAHRLTTVARCDQIVRLDNGHIAEIGSYQEVVARTAALE